jgi:hypothetical protein
MRRTPHKVWTWDPQSRRWDPDSGKAQLPMWFVYRVELYPHFGQPSGIVDQFGHQLQFLRLPALSPVVHSQRHRTHCADIGGVHDTE